MLMVVTYDVATDDTAGRRRLRRVARLCQNFGQRVQYSVFECDVNAAQWAVLRSQLIAEIDTKVDSLRFYRLGVHWRSRVEHVGTKNAYDPRGALVF